MNAFAKLTTAAAAAALTSFSTAANANYVYVSSEAVTAYGYAAYTGGNANGFSTGYNGQQEITFNLGATYDASSLTDAYVWCVDITHNIWIGNNPAQGATGIVYTVGDISDFTTDFDGHAISPATAEEIAAVAWYGDFVLGGSVSDPNDFGDAIEAEITSLEYGSTATGLTAQGTIDLASIQLWLSTAGTGYQAVLFYVPDPSIEYGDYAYQALIEGFPPGGPIIPPNIIAPEPLSLSLFGAGILGAAAMRRRKARRTAR